MTRHPRTRTRASVPWDAFDALLQQAIEATSSTQTQVMETIGYASSGVVAHWRDLNAAPLCAKYAMMGLLAELDMKLTIQQTIGRPFSYSDLLDLLSVLAREPEPKRALIATMARLIADY